MQEKQQGHEWLDVKEADDHERQHVNCGDHSDPGDDHKLCCHLHFYSAIKHNIQYNFELSAWCISNVIIPRLNHYGFDPL